MYIGKNVIFYGALAFFVLNTFDRNLGAQSCFQIKSAMSKVILDPAGMRNLPDDGDTLKIPCTSKVANFLVAMHFEANTEAYFEDTTQLVGTLAYKGLIIILQYDKATNLFKLPNDQIDLGAGNYFFTITANNCAPNGMSCDSCLYTQGFEVVYLGDSNFKTTIETKPNPPVLTCAPGNAVTLTGTALPNNNFSAQWYKWFNNQFVKIGGATTNIYAAQQAGTYRYALTGPAGCAATSDTIVLPPEFPAIILQPDTQILISCTQKITGVSIGNGGGAGNLQLAWTAVNGGVIKSGDSTLSPLISAPGTYGLTGIRKDNSCAASASLAVVLGNLPSVNVQITRDPDKTQLDCTVKQIALKATANLSTGTSDFTYQWPNSSGPDLLVNTPGNYAVTATATSNGCQGTSMVEIIQNTTPPQVTILSARDTVCAGESLALTAAPQEPAAFIWPDNSFGNSYFATPASDGDNTYSVVVTATGNGCTNSAVKTIFRVPMPEVSCPAFDLVVEHRGQLTIDCAALNGNLFWVTTPINVLDIPPLGDGAVQNQVFMLNNIQAPGVVQYFFYGKNAGCTSEKTEVRVAVTPGTEDGIYIPELITPNGDGMNDTWGIVLPDAIGDPGRYALHLYNRYGSLVFSGTLAVPFDAYKYPDGVYYYTLTKPDGGTLRGAVTILRRQ